MPTTLSTLDCKVPV